MSQFVGQDLDPLWLPTAGILDDIVGSWVNTSLAHTLADEIKIISFRQSNHVVKDGSRRRVDVVALSRCSFFEKPAVDSFAHDNVSESRREVLLLEDFLDFADFLFFDKWDLSVSNTITVDNNAVGKFIIDILVPEISRLVSNNR